MEDDLRDIPYEFMQEMEEALEAGNEVGDQFLEKCFLSDGPEQDYIRRILTSGMRLKVESVGSDFSKQNLERFGEESSAETRALLFNVDLPSKDDPDYEEKLKNLRLPASFAEEVKMEKRLLEELK